MCLETDSGVLLARNRDQFGRFANWGHRQTDYEFAGRFDTICYFSRIPVRKLASVITWQLSGQCLSAYD